jgi:hypothetical protein
MATRARGPGRPATAGCLESAVLPWSGSRLPALRSWLVGGMRRVFACFAPGDHAIFPALWRRCGAVEAWRVVGTACTAERFHVSLAGMRSRLVALVLVGTYLSLACGGCVSNEYVIPKNELARLAILPPSQRGAHVRVVQELGASAEWAVDGGEPVPEASYADEFAVYDRPEELVEAANQDVQVLLGSGPLPGARGGPVPGGSTWRPAMPRDKPRGSKAGGGGNLGLGNLPGGGGGGGGSGDELVVFAIIAVAVAVMAAAGLAVTEGVRYDGFVQLHPAQPVHVREPGGGERVLPLHMITPGDVAVGKEAVVRDDEAWGLRLAGRRPLDRQGFAFKVDMGALDSLCACYTAAGLASNIQLGYFVHQRFGLLGTLTLGGGTGPFAHVFQRHSANLEAQFFPLAFWRLHLGGFGHGGYQVARDEFGTRTGPAWGGGAVLEFALTTRLALTGRWDYTVARTAPDNQGWASTSTLTAGVAIY